MVFSEKPQYPIIHQDLAIFHEEIAFESNQDKTLVDGDDLSRSLGQKSILFHSGDGVSVLGLTLGQSLLHAYYLEWGAKLITILQSTGKPIKHLDEHQMTSHKKSMADLNHCEMFFEACKKFILRKHPEVDDFRVNT